MNLHQEKYSQFALVREMLETSAIIKKFSTKDLSKPAASMKETGALFLTGEGSSRIFPAKNLISLALKKKSSLAIHTEGCRQSLESELGRYTLFAASNSGKTKEVISLLKKKPGKAHFGLTANSGTPLEEICDETFVLCCGREDAVAATKSVVEQGLFYQALFASYQDKSIAASVFSELSDKASAALEQQIDPALISKISAAPIIYFAGRNNGVAEEATLKTNEITRKKSAYLEGTYAVHGIEEVMDPKEVVVVVDPFIEEEQKFKEVLVDGVGMTVISISSRDTLFPTIRIPSMEDFDSYIQLLACWNLLVETGISLGINLDTPVRARKIGNEFQGDPVRKK